MLFEGSILYNRLGYDVKKVREKYSNHLLFQNGFFGANLIQQSGSLVESYIGGFSPYLKETSIISNNVTGNIVSFLLEDMLSKARANLLGAGAWYSEENKELTLVRDLFGLVSLFYIHLPGKFIFFSTNLQDLLKNPQLSGMLDLNPGRIASYGSLLADSSSAYQTETFYKHIKSVPPGHQVRISIDTISIEPCHKFNPFRWSHLHTAVEFGEEFRAKFCDAVHRCVSGHSGSIASHLSGGLDSSSISTTIKYLFPNATLHTLYNISSGTDTDENLLAAEVARTIGSKHHEIQQAENDFDLFQLYIPLFGQPSSTLLSPSFNGSLMKYARSLGAESIFNGTAGDSIVGSGLELINRAFERGEWQLVKELLRKRVAYFSHSNQYPGWSSYSEDEKYHLVLQNFLFRRLAPQMFSLPFPSFVKLFLKISSHFGISFSYFLKRGGKSFFDRIKKGQINSGSILVDDLTRSMELKQHGVIYDLLETNASPEHQQSVLDVYSAQDMLAHEQDFVLSNHYQIINESPFYDKDLFELCIAVPDIIKYGDGIGRAHFREAMKGILVESVRTRSTKAQIKSLGQKITLRLLDQSKDFLYQSTEVWHYIDRTRFNQQVKILQDERIPYPHKVSTWVYISRTVSLAVWLEWLKGIKNNPAI